MSDFNIRRSITEDDIPDQGFRKSKYDPIYNSCRTLEKGEGIEIEVEKSHVRSVVMRGLKKRFPRRTFEITGRSQPKGYYLYIIRK